MVEEERCVLQVKDFRHFEIDSVLTNYMSWYISLSVSYASKLYLYNKIMMHTICHVHTENGTKG